MMEYLYQALRSERGICLQVSDPEKARSRLYTERRNAQDPDLDILSLVPSPTDPTQLWIVKRAKAEEPGRAGQSDPQP